MRTLGQVAAINEIGLPTSREPHLALRRAYTLGSKQPYGKQLVMGIPTCLLASYSSELSTFWARTQELSLTPP